MKIALIGYGKMGRAIEKIALEEQIEVVARLTSKEKKEMSQISQADVCLDFSKANSVLDHVRMLSEKKKNIILGTTGWEKDLDHVKWLVKKHKLGLLYAPNFSFGMYLLQKLVQMGSEIGKKLGFECALVEMHHQDKKDIPSGSAKKLLSLLSFAYEKKPAVASVRSGSIQGVHQVILNREDDMIEMTHRISNRVVFARGALAAAKWILGRSGFFTFEDFMEEVSCYYLG